MNIIQNVVSGSGSVAVSGSNNSTATDGISISGYMGLSVTGDGGISKTGDNGQAVAGVNGRVFGGDNSILELKWVDSTGRRRISTAYVGEDGILPNVMYRLDALGNFVKV